MRVEKETIASKLHNDMWRKRFNSRAGSDRCERVGGGTRMCDEYRVNCHKSATATMTIPPIPTHPLDSIPSRVKSRCDLRTAYMFSARDRQTQKYYSCTLSSSETHITGPIHNEQMAKTEDFENGSNHNDNTRNQSRKIARFAHRKYV